MRLGGPIYETFDTPEQWAQANQKAGWRAVYCPLKPEADEATCRAYAAAAEQAGLVIAEVGAWRNNTLSPDETQRKQAIENCAAHLALADRVGARCCVNIAGSRGEPWNGWHMDNFSRETFNLLVESLRAIIDTAAPARAAYGLEMKPWVFPDSAEQYLELIDAVDRKAFCVHLDPVNIISSPRRLYDNSRIVRHLLRTLGPHIRSIHVKDVTMSQKQLVHIDECRPGTGHLDLAMLLREADRLPADTPLMMEHLPNAEEYALAAEHLRGVAQQEGIAL